MYNQDIKQRYIDKKEQDTIIAPGALKNLFEKTEKYEMELDKDVCNFTYYEISEFYKVLGASSIGILNSMNSKLSQYTAWCLKEGLIIDGQNHFSEFSSSSLKDFLNLTKIKRGVISRQEILALCNKIVNPREKFIILSLFEYGKSKNFIDISCAKLSDINDNTLTLHSGRKVTISNELKKFAIDSYAATEYYLYSGKKTKITLIDDGTIIKQHPNVRSDDAVNIGRRMYNTIIRIFNMYDMKGINPNKVVMSGVLHMVLTRSAEINISPKEYLNSDYIKEIADQYGFSGSTFKQNFVLTYADYLE